MEVSGEFKLTKATVGPRYWFGCSHFVLKQELKSLITWMG